MNPESIIPQQTEDAYGWVNKIIQTIPYETWDTTPEIIESNVTWQVGHLIMSFYYHSVMVIVGHQMDILQKIPIKEYNALFTNAAPHIAMGKTNPEQLQNHLMLMQQKSVEIIQSLSPQDLDAPLEPTQVPHPIAKTKYEALDWNIKHTMWHCGQLGILKRIIHERIDFGLKKG